MTPVVEFLDKVGCSLGWVLASDLWRCWLSMQVGSRGLQAGGGAVGRIGKGNQNQDDLNQWSSK